ncbi:glycosyltransferase [bacterium]|nr:glycosyltransferase [bacterium]MBU1957065.1 glycosyltransferase [bacterium]
MEKWREGVNKPLVSICCISFNHEAFLEKALDSFLIQETNFPFEILVHDDASTDRSADIIREYEAKYPNLIKPIYQTENQYSQNIEPMSAYNYSRAKGKYIAVCEGDDYWTGTDKLQLQADFLEANDDYSICYHNSTVVDENDTLISTMKHPCPTDYSKDEMLLGEMFILTNTILFKTFTPDELEDFRNQFREAFNGDMALMHHLGFLGKCKYMENIDYAAYRVHSGGIWSAINEVKKIIHLSKSKRLMQENLSSRPDLIKKMDQSIASDFAVSLSRILLSLDFKGYKRLISIIREDERLSFKQIFLEHLKYMTKRVFARMPFFRKNK